MATITPWLASLIESELENVITWKSILKPDPDASKVSRFSDDGSNFKSVVDSSLLNSESKIQILDKPGLNARAKFTVSDGEVSILASLSDTAWEAYDADLEEDEQPRKNDVLLCKKITLFSTTYGPSEERVKLRIEDLELIGNHRKPIGAAKPLLEQPSILALRQKIEDLRLKQLQSKDPVDQDEGDENEDDDDDEEEDAEDVAIKPEPDREAEENEEEIANASNTLNNAVPPTFAVPEIPQKLPPDTPHKLTRRRFSPAAPDTTTTSDIAIESQFPQEAIQTQSPLLPKSPLQSRNPVRRTRGGFSMGRETRGDNLAGPQAPTLHKRQNSPAMEPGPAEPPRNKLLEVMSKLPGQGPKKRSPEASASVSAQVTTEEVVVETPTKAPKRTPATFGTQNSTQPPRKRYRIPRDQKALLDNPSSWIPSLPGHEFPHPNVPIALLKAWNARAAALSKSSSQPSPIATIEQSSMVKSIEKVRQEPQATAAAESEDESDDSSASEDEPLPDWSPSPSRRSQMLPPDSSVAHDSAPPSRDGSRGNAISGSEHMPISLDDDVPADSPGSRHSIAANSDKQKETPQSKRKVDSQTPLNNSHVLASSMRPPRSAETRSSRPPSSHNSGPMKLQLPFNNDRSPAPRSSHPTPFSSKLADNFHGPVRASTQQTPDLRRRSYNTTDQASSVSSPVTAPLGAPSGPKAWRDGHESSQARRNSNSVSDKTPRPSGGFYRPFPSGSVGSQILSGGKTTASREHVAETQTPTSTNEMESGVPRAYHPSKYHQDRTEFYRDAQRKQWLEFNLPKDSRATISSVLLLQSYQENYETDPVTQQEFTKLIRQLRPSFVEKYGRGTRTTDTAAVSTAVERASTARSQAEEGSEMAEERNGSVEAPPSNNAFMEFVNVWKQVGLGGGRSNKAVGSRPQKRQLDVLSWGFGE